nr:hypothetical protein [Tanacetum cinerariifolium]
LFGLEHDLVPLGTAGFLLVASIPEGIASNIASLYFQRLRPNCDTLPGRRYPSALFEGSPMRAIRDGDSVRILAVAADRPNFSSQVAFLTTDTAGTIGPGWHAAMGLSLQARYSPERGLDLPPPAPSHRQPVPPPSLRAA